MLVLTRKATQQITVLDPNGNQITITLVKVSGDKVRLGIDAPRHMTIVRNELLLDAA